MIGLIDYGMGNLRSVVNGFESVGANIKVIKNPLELKHFDKLVLPGVGAFSDGMHNLLKNGMNDAINEFIYSKKPFLGICLGMQLLFEESEEFGRTNGLAILKGSVQKFKTDGFDKNIKIPHAGWNSVVKTKKQSLLLKNLPTDTYLYFVHSFHVNFYDDYMAGSTHYGYDFPSVIEHENVFGIQPHPEKSHDYGLKILKNFTEL